MVRPAPAIVIAAASSGSGKTTVATGLMGALRAQGHRVAPFKVGPDYIDPGYHTLAAGRTGRNLDPVLVGDDLIAPLYAHGSRGADIGVVEGVMGLFDGRVDDSTDRHLARGSTAQVAALLGAPVVMVLDGRGLGQSAAALLHGFLTFEPGVRICGVILNGVGSTRHERVLRQACAHVGLPVYGAIPRDDSLAVPSRHLGLIPAAESGSAAVAAVARMADVIGSRVDIPALCSAAAVADLSGTRPWSASDALIHRDDADRFLDGRAESSGDHRFRISREPRIAIAGGKAFTFGYAEHREMLDATGAETVMFDPLADPLPPNTDAVVLGGGFPEEHASDLSANVLLRTGLAAHARAGGPVYAECAGLLYLSRELDGHPMAAVLDVAGHFTPKLTLGYRDAVALADSSVYPAGSRVVGHEFHRSVIEVTSAAGATGAWGWCLPSDPGLAAGAYHHVDGVIHGRVHASYLHIHPVSQPAAVARFVRAAGEYSERRIARARP